VFDNALETVIVGPLGNVIRYAAFGSPATLNNAFVATTGPADIFTPPVEVREASVARMHVPAVAVTDIVPKWRAVAPAVSEMGVMILAPAVIAVSVDPCPWTVVEKAAVIKRAAVQKSILLILIFNFCKLIYYLFEGINLWILQRTIE